MPQKFESGTPNIPGICGLCAGMEFVKNKGINNIFIKKSLSYYKRRKTLLHELAHIELNHLCQCNKDLFAFHINKYEDEADEYIKFLLE